MLKYTTFTHLPNTFQHPQYVPFFSSRVDWLLSYYIVNLFLPSIHVLPCHAVYFLLLTTTTYSILQCHLLLPCQRFLWSVMLLLYIDCCLVYQSTWQLFISPAAVLWSVLKMHFHCFLDTYTLSFCYWKLCLVWWSHSLFLHSQITICACLKRKKMLGRKETRVQIGTPATQKKI